MKRIICFTLFVFILTSCEKKYVQQKEIPDNISFSIDIIPIFSNNCESCHQSGGFFPGLILSFDIAYDQLLTDGTNAPYINITDPDKSQLYIKMNTNMPPGGLLSSSKIAIVLKWIEEGAGNN